ncbi:MAG: thioredoxin domain-containing protein [Deltaproteobacteria bacterium]|nr:thioredoxin domain-containing protein [Deltaproteobacteria bacterium]
MDQSIDTGQRRPNRLIHEKSPYLLQHAFNPVDWYPWGQEAFARAKAENKPVFLSIGYSTCHWCHVMERESFENPAIAELMNRWFVNIKVDREERPDVDRVYMAYVQAATGSGGWPMSVFLTPDLKPFYGGTYFPPEDRFGQPGFATLLRALAQAFAERREEVERAAGAVVRELQEAASGAGPVEILNQDVLVHAFRAFEASFDERYGGFGKAPKFPRPVVHNFLLRTFARTGNERAAKMVLTTLESMSRGGVYDHLGGGFHRYSVDRQWHLPHFEKMLYDQAQLVVSLVEAFQASKNPFFTRVARETCDYVLREMTSVETGGFFSAEDAESQVGPEGEKPLEGAFYAWSKDEIDGILGPEALPVFCYHHGVRPQGNVDDPHGELTGKNVIWVAHSVEETASQFGLPAPQVERLLTEARARLLAARNLRPRPHLDDKILCDWNGLMISGLARAYQVLEDPRYLEAAERAAEFLTTRLWDAEARVLYHRFRAGEVAIEGYLEDYAMLAQGLIDLYETSFDVRWLLFAEKLTERQVEVFYDEAEGGFFSTSGRDVSVLVRIKDDYDGAEPAGNSVAVLNLLRLAEMVGRPEWAHLAEQTFRFFSHRLRELPHALPQMLVALDFALSPPPQVVIAAERDDEGLRQFLRVLHGRFLPHRVLLLCDEVGRQALSRKLPHLSAMTKVEGRPTAYACRNQACERQVTDPAVLMELLLARDLYE